MKDLAEEYLLVCEADGYTVETIRQKRVLLNQFIRYCNQNDVEDVEEIASAFLRKWILDEKTRCKANSINSKIQHIRPFFNWLIEEEIIEKSPWAKIKLLKSPPPIIPAYDKEDIHKMLNYWKGNKFMPVRNKTMIICLAETGVRNSEMRNIKLTDISNNAIRIMGKGNKIRYVPLSKVLKVQLNKYLRIRKEYMEGHESDLLFVSRYRRNVTRFALVKLIKEMGEVLDIDVAKTIHNFRRFYIQNMIEKIDIYTLSKTVGHMKISTTQRYLESIADKRILERASKHSPLST
ncbi:tyrosine-type recombinase/integrase [Bacillus sp. ISL-18]|uniref:tyrosine-type recombinase/integrase n=1 Tax=Bacillus sp. ISL-18 TaxID=2819118 RepID=UPI001BE88D61|nr:tyrosine-type recombinase/integrase [Bacillus sp. ISL-18]MBT2656642.1 tyrosine-type recombinase/integrase [Bacillus sp. ISL-18]